MLPLFIEVLLAIAALSATLVNSDESAYGDLSSKMDCTSSILPFDPLQHKTTYKVAVHAVRGLNAARNANIKIYEDYLTATAGQRFDPPIKFEMEAVTSWVSLVARVSSCLFVTIYTFLH